MMDWRKIERGLIDGFRQIGLRPKTITEWPRADNNGQWIVNLDEPLIINLTELARCIESIGVFCDAE